MQISGVMLSLLITLLVVVLVIYLIQTLLVMVDPPVRNILSIIVAILALAWLFGFAPAGPWHR